MAIVTMSHEIGAGGPEIGQQLAERLGCRYVDHELISNAVHNAPVDASSRTPSAKRTVSRRCRAQYCGRVTSASVAHVPERFEMNGIVGALSVTDSTARRNAGSVGSIIAE